MKTKQNYPLHIILFLLSLIGTTLAGYDFINATSISFQVLSLGYVPGLDEVMTGLPFSLSFLLFLTVHEFGHYFTAVYHKVKTSLPYYIPIFIPYWEFINIGSLGAVIRLYEMPPTTRKFFDIGVAGPLAGFVVSLGLLVYGFTHLPDPEGLILNLHPSYYDEFCGIPTLHQLINSQFHRGMTLLVGSNLLFELLQYILVDDLSQMPPAFELMHYPYLFVGFLTLFFTALNLLPIGQLDGGHVVYGLFGQRRAFLISRITVFIMILGGGFAIMRFGSEYTLIGYLVYFVYLQYIFSKIFSLPHLLAPAGLALGMMGVQFLLSYLIPEAQPAYIWLLYAFIVTRFLGLAHPLAQKEEPLNLGRKILGWLAILIFILCFSPQPLYFVGAL